MHPCLKKKSVSLKKENSSDPKVYVCAVLPFDGLWDGGFAQDRGSAAGVGIDRRASELDVFSRYAGTPQVQAITHDGLWWIVKYFNDFYSHLF